METRYFKQTDNGLDHSASMTYIDENLVEVEFHYKMADGQSRMFVNEYDLTNSTDKSSFDTFLSSWSEVSQAENWGIVGKTLDETPNLPDTNLDDLFVK